jgi:hypothetical protein
LKPGNKKPRKCGNYFSGKRLGAKKSSGKGK